MRNIQLVSGLPFSVPAIEDWTDKLPHHPKLTWDGIETPRKPEDINTIVIHHTASEAPLENQAKYHVNTHGWPGLSYHLIISGGKVIQANDLLSFTYHVASNNGYTVAICIHGDLSKRDMTSQERELLYAAILTVKSLLPITQILGHNQLNNTSCPCTSMNTIRTDITTLEHKMAQSNTWEGKMKEVAALFNQYNYMSNLMKAGPDDGNAQWACSQLLDVAAIMKSRGLL